MTLERGGRGLVAECVLRSGAELSAKVRKGEPELVEEAGTRSAGLRVIKDKRVASTSTSDLTDAGIERFVSDALELVGLSQEDPFAGPADPKLLCDPAARSGPRPLRPRGRRRRRGAGDRDRAGRARRRRFAFDPRITNSEGATFGRTAGGVGDRAVERLPRGVRRARTSRSASCPSPPTRAARTAAATTGPRKRYLAELDPPAEVGREAARRTLRKLGARTVATCEAPVVFDPDAARSHPRHARRLRDGQRDLAQVELPRRPRGDARRERSRDHRRRSAHPARARLARRSTARASRAATNVVVEKGMLRTYLCDSYSARKLGRESTASASRGGGAGVGPSTSNFVLQPGTDSNEAIVKAHAARPLRDRDDGLRLQRRDRRLLARRLRLLDRERRARLSR